MANLDKINVLREAADLLECNCGAECKGTCTKSKIEELIGVETISNIEHVYGGCDFKMVDGSDSVWIDVDKATVRIFRREDGFVVVDLSREKDEDYDEEPVQTAAIYRL